MKKERKIKRCPWVKMTNESYVKYHDEEWGRPVYDDRVLFEFLILEGAQAGLSWETVLRKRNRYRELFCNFDPQKVAKLTKAQLGKILKDEGIIRNRLKVESTVVNAKAFLDVQKEYGTFSNYLWGFLSNKKPIVNRPKTAKDYSARTALSDEISKDLKKRGFKFVGSTIVYAYLQAVGLVNDHSRECYISK
ncbi:MAG: DNA-3-methyladenine glycosylase I [Oligoflexia bacterium]|nr:DNA-3-methyladenine glycosylase I [Oligoflexia bacterium]